MSEFVQGYPIILGFWSVSSTVSQVKKDHRIPFLTFRRQPYTINKPSFFSLKPGSVVPVEYMQNRRDSMYP
jgi:hypothetical protein